MTGDTQCSAHRRGCRPPPPRFPPPGPPGEAAPGSMNGGKPWRRTGFVAGRDVGRLPSARLAVDQFSASGHQKCPGTHEAAAAAVLCTRRDRSFPEQPAGKQRVDVVAADCEPPVPPPTGRRQGRTVTATRSSLPRTGQAARPAPTDRSRPHPLHHLLALFGRHALHARTIAITPRPASPQPSAGPRPGLFVPNSRAVFRCCSNYCGAPEVGSRARRAGWRRVGPPAPLPLPAPPARRPAPASARWPCSGGPARALRTSLVGRKRMAEFGTDRVVPAASRCSRWPSCSFSFNSGFGTS